MSKTNKISFLRFSVKMNCRNYPLKHKQNKLKKNKLKNNV